MTRPSGEPTSMAERPAAASAVGASGGRLASVHAATEGRPGLASGAVGGTGGHGAAAPGAGPAGGTTGLPKPGGRGRAPRGPPPGAGSPDGGAPQPSSPRSVSSVTPFPLPPLLAAP